MSKTAGSDSVSATNDPQQILFKTLPDLETLSREALGKAGAVYKTDTSAVTGNFGCITALEDSSFTSLSSANWSGNGSPTYTGLPLKAGASIFGEFTGFQLLSGKVLAYKDR